jgi:hypothetical protein
VYHSSSADSERVTKRPKLNEKRPQSSSAISTIAPRPARTIQSYPSIELEQASPTKKHAPKPKNALNLTIIAPSYHEQLSGIRSAPLHSNHPPPPAQGYHKSNLGNSL